MAEQAEAGHVGAGVHAGLAGKLGAKRVEQGGGAQHRRIVRLREPALLESGAEHPDAQPLGQQHYVAVPRAGVAQQLVRMDGAECDQPVDRLRGVDGVAAGDRNAGAGAHRGAAGQDLLDRRDADAAERHAEDGQRQDRPAAHGVDVRQRVGGGDAAEIVRIVDHGREEVGGGDQGGVRVQPPDGGVIGGIRADQQILELPGLWRGGEDRLQHRGRQLAAAAAAMRQRGEPRSGVWSMIQPSHVRPVS